VKFCSIVIALISFAAYAFSADGGSVYSSFGIGEILTGTSTRSDGMGYTSIGLAGATSLNGTAPASWAKLNKTRVEAGFLFEGFSSTDGNKSLYLSHGSFKGALLAVPISPTHGITFVAGITPYSTVRYDVFTGGSLHGVDYTINSIGSGGISKAQVGLSYAPTENFSLGVSLDYLFGSIDYEQTFSPPSTTVFSGKRTDNLSAHGIVVSAGGLFTGSPDLVEPLRRLSVGFVLTSRGSLRAERQTTYEFQTFSERDSSEISTGRLGVPIAYGLGASYQIGERVLVAADYYAQPWANADFNGLGTENPRNSARIGVGVERIGNRDVSAAWLDRLSYRVGFSSNRTYYRVNGEDINEWAVTGGVGVPLSGDTQLNIALAYGGRGVTSNNLLKENIFRLTCSLNVGELWFTRFEEE
jgi:hypothetical protein